MFRHGFADAWLRAGGSPNDLQGLAGWRSPQMVNRYAAANRAEHAREATGGSRRWTRCERRRCADHMIDPWGVVIAKLVCDKHRGREVGTVRVHRDGRINVVLTRSRWHRSIHHPDSLTKAKEAHEITELADFTGGCALCRRCGWLDVSAELVAEPMPPCRAIR
jgi:hypothetical protein